MQTSYGKMLKALLSDWEQTRIPVINTSIQYHIRSCTQYNKAGKKATYGVKIGKRETQLSDMIVCRENLEESIDC